MPFMKVSLFRCRKRARAVLHCSGIAPVIAALTFLSFFALLGLCALCERLMLAVPSLPRSVSYVISVAASVLIGVLLLAPLSLGIDAFVLEHLRHGKADYSILLSFYTAHKRYLAATARMLSRFLRFFGFLRVQVPFEVCIAYTARETKQGGELLWKTPFYHPGEAPDIW